MNSDVIAVTFLRYSIIAVRTSEERGVTRVEFSTWGLNVQNDNRNMTAVSQILVFETSTFAVGFILLRVCLDDFVTWACPLGGAVAWAAAELTELRNEGRGEDKFHVLL